MAEQLEQPLSLHPMDATTVFNGSNCFFSFFEIGAIEGWIQIDKLLGQATIQRIITINLTGQKNKVNGSFSENKDASTEFCIEFSGDHLQFVSASGKVVSKTPFLAGEKPHHFCLNMHANDGSFGLSIDGSDFIPIKGLGNLSDYFIDSVTIGQFKEIPCFTGGVAALHFWKSNLTINKIISLSKWNNNDGKGHYCPTPEFKFTAIDSSNLLGYLNPDVPAFLFYREPTGCWVIDGVDGEVPKQADLSKQNINSINHSVYEPAVYFLTAREINEKEQPGYLYIISDKGLPPLRIQPDETKQFIFLSVDPPYLNFQFKYNPLSNVLESREWMKISAKNPVDTIPDVFKGQEPNETKCIRPNILGPNSDMVESLTDIFTHNPSSMVGNLKGWNEVLMQDPFLSTDQQQVKKELFMIPPSDTGNGDSETKNKYYKRPSEAPNMAVPYGFNYKQSNLTRTLMNSALISNGSELMTGTSNSRGFHYGADFNIIVFSAGVKFNCNEEFSSSQKKMYSNSVMHSEHTCFATVYTLVLDKSNVHLNIQKDQNGYTFGFLPDIYAYANGDDGQTGKDIIEKYGTHYANAVRYGVRGRGQYRINKSSMTHLLENCHNVAFGLDANLGVNIEDVGAQASGGYTSTQKTEDKTQIETAKDLERSSFTCLGGGIGCSSEGVPGSDANYLVPVFLDLRPITEILAPPFFSTYEMTVTVRNRLQKELDSYLSGNNPIGIDVFSFYSLSFLEPQIEKMVLTESFGTSNNNLKSPTFQFSSLEIKVNNCQTKEPEEVTGQIDLTTINKELTESPKFIFCISPMNSKQMQIELNLESLQLNYFADQKKLTPNQFRFSDVFKQNNPNQAKEPDGNSQLLINFNDGQLNSKDGINKDFLLYAEEVAQWAPREYPQPPPSKPLQTGSCFLVKFSVKLQKLDLHDAFHNGLPKEWKGVKIHFNEEQDN